MPLNYLSQSEAQVILKKATEQPFTGEYDDFFVDGTFICRQCNAPLYSFRTKFEAGCGWPAFDAEFPDSVHRVSDDDGQRTEIQCSNCGGHLGHVFIGEQHTETNTRHCVNSLSIRFVPKGHPLPKVLHAK